MSDKTIICVAGIIALTVLTAIYGKDAALITAPLLAVVATFWGALHTQQTRDENTKQTKLAEETHTLVNSQKDELLEKIAELERLLKESKSKEK
jgi:activator of 2-hydroxyglutaryl-CoA dehydratase